MNKIRHFKRILTHLRSFNVPRVNPVRNFSTGKDSDEEDKKSPTSESRIAETENVESTKAPEPVQLSGFAKSYDKFSHLDDPKKPEKSETFSSLIRYSKFVDVCFLLCCALSRKLFI